MSAKEVKVEYKVIGVDCRITKTNEPYYVLELLDANKTKHEARLWNDFIPGIPEQYLPQEGQYWGSVKSRENVFRRQKQLVIEAYLVIRPEDITEAVKEQFMEKPVIDVDRVIKRMFDWEFWEPDMYALMHNVREHFRNEGVWDKIKAVPAGASYHHSVRGGLLLHIDEMLSFSERLCDVYVYGSGATDSGRPELGCDVAQVNGLNHYTGLVDYQILRAGIVLHDIGKLYDYDEKTLQFQSNPTSECLEHTIVGILMVERYWVKDSPEAIDRGLRLMHALAAHHGQEMGAVKPKTPEAILLHSIDMMSAHLDVCRRAYDDAKKNGTLSEYSKMLRVSPFIPDFFPSDTLWYPRRKELDQVVTEKVESESKTTEKLLWED